METLEEIDVISPGLDIEITHVDPDWVVTKDLLHNRQHLLDDQAPDKLPDKPTNGKGEKEEAQEVQSENSSPSMGMVLTRRFPPLTSYQLSASKRRVPSIASGMVKQWSMDETQSWFYSQSRAQPGPCQVDRTKLLTPDENCFSGLIPSGVIPMSKVGGKCSSQAERRRKLFQRKGPTHSVPCYSDIKFPLEVADIESDCHKVSYTEGSSCSQSSLNCFGKSAEWSSISCIQDEDANFQRNFRQETGGTSTGGGTYKSTVSKALGEAFRASLFGWESMDRAFEKNISSYSPSRSSSPLHHPPPPATYTTSCTYVLNNNDITLGFRGFTTWPGSSGSSAALQFSSSHGE